MNGQFKVLCGTLGLLQHHPDDDNPLKVPIPQLPPGIPHNKQFLGPNNNQKGNNKQHNNVAGEQGRNGGGQCGGGGGGGGGNYDDFWLVTTTIQFPVPPSQLTTLVDITDQWASFKVPNKIFCFGPEAMESVVKVPIIRTQALKRQAKWDVAQDWVYSYYHEALTKLSATPVPIDLNNTSESTRTKNHQTNKKNHTTITKNTIHNKKKPTRISNLPAAAINNDDGNDQHQLPQSQSQSRVEKFNSPNKRKKKLPPAKKV